jgi:hypothetical protein
MEKSFQLMAPAGLSEVCLVITYCEDNFLRECFVPSTIALNIRVDSRRRHSQSEVLLLGRSPEV